MSISRRVSLGLCAALLFSLILLIGFEPRTPPPPALWIGQLPVRGSMADAQKAGFTHCNQVTRTVRCRRDDVMIAGRGPFVGALDLYHADGSGGFYQLTLWHPTDQDDAVYDVGPALKAQGWSLCRTGPNEFRGDQEVYTKAGAPVRFSIDISYWGKRRLRVLPELNQPIGHCWSR